MGQTGNEGTNLYRIEEKTEVLKLDSAYLMGGNNYTNSHLPFAPYCCRCVSMFNLVSRLLLTKHCVNTFFLLAAEAQ